MDSELYSVIIAIHLHNWLWWTLLCCMYYYIKITLKKIIKCTGTSFLNILMLTCLLLLVFARLIDGPSSSSESYKMRNKKTDLNFSLLKNNKNIFKIWCLLIEIHLLNIVLNYFMFHKIHIHFGVHNFLSLVFQYIFNIKSTTLTA